jgi:DNA-binding transcriptional LysR family regulator
VDLCIRVGRGEWPGVAKERLFSQIIFPVCAPAVAERLSRPADLASVPIIREPRPNFGWEDWLADDGLAPELLQEGPVFSDASLCLDAAISGSGVFLTFETLAVDALMHGRLVEPFGRRRATANAYWLVTAEGRPLPPPARLFRRWLLREIAAAGLGSERGG